jgi:sigma-B regulation protein RsbU (phosphoserine phosphatase)
VELDVFHTLPGRLFLLSSLLVAVIWIAQRLTTLPDFFEIFRKVVTLAWLGSSLWVVVMAIVRNRHKLLWRVRRKLILSYVLLGVIPVALVLLFAICGGFVLYLNVSTYLFNEGVRDLVEQVNQTATATAVDIGQSPADTAAILVRGQRNLAALSPAISFADVPSAAGGSPMSAGAWRHLPPPRSVPAWLSGRSFKGVLVLRSDGQAEPSLLIRAAVPVPGRQELVVVDLPVDAGVITRLHADTGTLIEHVSFELTVTPPPPAAGSAASDFTVTAQDTSVATVTTTSSVFQLFRRTVAFLTVTDWATGTTGQAGISLDAPLGALLRRMASAQSTLTAGFLLLLIVLAVLFLIIQGVALLLGSALAHSITYAIHELFVGTERVQQGDFTHRINITSRDQLGDLSSSFNRMSSSIEHLLHVQREKQRLDDELRIAREIQKSLLPADVPRLAGLSVADLCEPAREVGGDYYDFFELGPRQLGVLVADVAGKGTSAALYSAELKGLMLALSRMHRSPRRLMIEMNDLLSAHLDNKSFITATYAVIDLDAGTLTVARAGHTPLLVVSAGESEVVVPDGMVLGLRLPGASERFAAVLKEHARPLHGGDVVVLYTDGITEAMNLDGDLFGEAALSRVVLAHRDLDAPGIRERILREVKAFVGDAEPHDDMTMVVIKVMETAPAA